MRRHSAHLYRCVVVPHLRLSICWGVGVVVGSHEPLQPIAKQDGGDRHGAHRQLSGRPQQGIGDAWHKGAVQAVLCREDGQGGQARRQGRQGGWGGLA